MNLPSRLSLLYLHVKQALIAAGVLDTAERDSRLIIRQHTGFDWADLVARPDEVIAPAALAQIAFDMERRIAGTPLSRIYGERGFWGLDFRLNTETLDPRPDTETLIEVALHAMESAPPVRILDLGTGTGCILISLLREWPLAWGLGVDKSFGAITMARQNAIDNGVAARAGFVCGSWAKSLSGAFDLIVTNPPYIPNREIAHLSPEVRNHDPILALDGGDDGLEAYRKIFMQTSGLLAPGGLMLCEFGFGQADDVARLSAEFGFLPGAVHPDLAGVARVVEIRRGDK